MRIRSAQCALIIVALATLGLASCQASKSSRDAAVDGPAHTADATDGSAPALPPACGGTVQIKGTTPFGSFDAQYVFVSLTPCGGILLIDVAQSDSSTSGVIRITMTEDPQTNSYLGPSTPTATYVAPGPTDAQSSLGAAVDITAFPPTIYLDQDGGRDPVAGTINIDTAGFSISGSFSSPLCGVVACG